VDFPENPEAREREQIQASLDRSVRDALRPVAVGLGLCYASVVPALAVLQPAASGPLLMGASVLTSVVCTALWMFWRRRPVAPARAHGAATALGAIVLANAVALVVADPAPRHTMVFGLLVMAAGFLLLSWRWLAVLMTATLGAWGILAWASPDPRLWIDFGFTLAASSAAAGILHRVRVRTISRMERLHLESEERRQQLEETVEAAAREVAERRAQNLLLEQVARGASLHDGLEAVARVLEDQARGLRSSVLLVDEKAGCLRSCAAPSLPVEYTSRVDGIPIGEEEGCCGTAAYRGERVIVEDIASDPLWAKYKELALAHGLRACWSQPVFARERRVVATIALYFHEPRAPTGQEIRLIESAAHLASLLIERDVASREREQLQSGLFEARRLESVGLLAGGVAHDFNNLLAGVVGNAELALETLGEAETLRPLLLDVARAGKRAALLTRQLLEYAGRTQRTVVPLDLSVQVREIADLIRSGLHRNARIELDLPSSLPAVEADPAQIQQIVMNLVINSSEALGKDGGCVRIRVGLAELSAAEAGSLEPSAARVGGRYVVLRVEDDGCGMDEATRSRIFDPFFSTKERGSGLGLAAALGIVRSHGGGLRVESQPGVGTNFTVFLPESLRPAVVAPETRRAEFTATGTALLIDDESVVRRVLRRYLQRIGFDVIDAEGGREGIERLAVAEAPVKVAVVDMNMPGMTGEETLAALRELQPGLPVVLVSGYDETDASARLLREPRVGFLPKPFTRADLGECIQAVLEARE
jgi:two-component system cell cycle sensor histidine kinase/response regulator CckA